MHREVATDADLEIPSVRELIRESVRALAILDRNFCYMLYSERWLTDYRLEARGWQGVSIYASNPNFPPRWAALHGSCLHDGITHNVENEWVTRADNSGEWVSWHCRPWRNAQGELAGIVISSEIT